MSYFVPMNCQGLRLFVLPILMLLSSALMAQDCPAGESAFELRVHTDAWGYEVYWELSLDGMACGDSPLYWGGNAENVGCDGEGIPGAPSGNYASNSTFILDTLCAAPDVTLNLHHIDDYGDGGTFFEVLVEGVVNHSFSGTGNGNLWAFNPFESIGPAYDSPCGAVEIEVNGPQVVVNNDSCTAAYGELGGGTFPGVYGCQINGGWCEGAVTGSAWLTFEATAGNCLISACNDTTDFDTQMALWKAEDCSDFGTYTLVGANDDLPGGCGPGAYYASSLWTGCLDSGATYLIQIDGWASSVGTAGVTIQTQETDEQITGVTGGLACPLGKEEVPNGTVVLNPIGVGSDFTAAWIGPDGFSGEGQQISGLPSGTYSAVIVSNCGSTFTYSVTLDEPDPISLDLELVAPGCPDLPDGEAYLGVAGGTEPYTITWSGELGVIETGTVISDLGEGQYSVVMEDDNGCTQELDFTLEANDDAFSFSLGTDTTICDDEQLVLSAPAGLEYLWSNGSVDQFIVVDGADLGPGTYPFIVEASNPFGCSHADAIFVTVYNCTNSVGEVVTEESQVQVYPNPAHGVEGWTLSWNGALQGWTRNWSLRDVTGRVVQKGRVSEGQNTAAVTALGLAQGQYVWHAEGTTVSLRVQLN